MAEIRFKSSSRTNGGGGRDELSLSFVDSVETRWWEHVYSSYCSLYFRECLEISLMKKKKEKVHMAKYIVSQGAYEQ